MDKSTTKKTIKFYLKHIGGQKFLTSLVFMGVFVAVSANAVFPIVIKFLVDDMTLGTDTIQLADLTPYLFAFITAHIVNVLGWRIAVYSMVILQPRAMARIGEECFHEIHKHSFDFFNNEFVGSLVKKVSRMVGSFEHFLDLVAFDLFTKLLRLTLAIIVLFFVNYIFGLAMLLWTILFLSINYKLALHKLQTYDVPKTKSDSMVTAYLADTISNNNNIKFFSTRLYEERGFSRVVSTWKKLTTKSWMFDSHVETGQHIAMVLLETFMIVTAIYLWQRGQVTIGDFVLIQAYLSTTFIFVWEFGRNVRRLFEAFADAAEMTVILNKPIGIKDKKDAKDMLIKNGKVELKNVHFSYEDGEKAIHGLSIKVKAGEKIALIGPSGGGKTTITKLILRLFDVNKGKILIDGQDISKVKQDSLRSQVALVPQDPVLFHRSLIENIRYGRLDASDEEVIAAAKMANCHQFITKFPKGYKTFVGERGVKLSGGERQRIAIARAILSNAKILIFDEATSNLDVDSEKLIQEALQHLTKNRTTITIAHRLSTVRNMDRIFVIKNGELVQEGSHCELVKDTGGLYSELWNLYMKKSA